MKKSSLGFSKIASTQRILQTEHLLIFGPHPLLTMSAKDSNRHNVIVQNEDNHHLQELPVECDVTNNSGGSVSFHADNSNNLKSEVSIFTTDSIPQLPKTTNFSVTSSGAYDHIGVLDEENTCYDSFIFPCVAANITPKETIKPLCTMNDFLQDVANLPLNNTCCMISTSSDPKREDIIKDEILSTDGKGLASTQNETKKNIVIKYSIGDATQNLCTDTRPSSGVSEKKVDKFTSGTRTFHGRRANVISQTGSSKKYYTHGEIIPTTEIGLNCSSTSDQRAFSSGSDNHLSGSRSMYFSSTQPKRKRSPSNARGIPKQLKCVKPTFCIQRKEKGRTHPHEEPLKVIPLSCLHCFAIFKNINLLKMHQFVHTRDYTATWYQQHGKLCESFCCRHCGQLFRSEKSMKRHENVHRMSTEMKLSLFRDGDYWEAKLKYQMENHKYMTRLQDNNCSFDQLK